MACALRLAERGLYTTQPNPRVGCVIVQGEEIVGKGWHARAGAPHAEVFALREAGTRARGACVYVTLEPCAHLGRTPPCADTLIEAGVARVVASCGDSNPKTAGGGFAKLRAAGIVVEKGLIGEQARELNRGFFSRMERDRPWVRVKLAMSLDGRTALANSASKWITGEAARADVQRWRARSSAILTGAGTARTDNPRLTMRKRGQSHFSPQDSISCNGPPKNDSDPFSPLRVVLDARLDALQQGAHLLDGDASTLVLHARDAKPCDDRYARTELVAVAVDDCGRLDLDAVMAVLAQRDVNELQVEAGPALCGALFAQGSVDELLLYVAPVLLGDTARPLLNLPSLTDVQARWKLRVIDQRQVGEDWRLLMRPDAENG
ncbi:MAG: bifunctional diaminohydroxyphosphoribosylaminopyrimidine deaminase/5-amino-6-(5-phosphoribosylamino)uracil reductase RibD [Pseudomonadota bacterium]|nr:bifunctional diaminohydroxyphosphoribosylaminopyrimidine deaminase/5-amino-6-(5-phosphoribosylamino)uracil reductase RibD [Pseudomonadota bacterium]